MRSTAALGAVLFAGAGLSACGGGVPGNAVASVAGMAIAKSAFNHWMNVAAASNSQTTGKKAVVPIPPKYTACIANLKSSEENSKTPPSESTLKKDCEQQRKNFVDAVMTFLIQTEWVFQEANKLGVKLTDKEVRKYLEKLREREFPTEADFKKFLKSSGESVSDLLLRVKFQMLVSRIQKHVTKSATASVTPAAIAKYYELHKSSYGTPESKDLLVVLTKTEAQAKEAKQEIEGGKSFASVAEKRSIDPTSKANGGKLEDVTRGEEDKQLESAVFAAKEKVLSGPVKTPFGYYIFEVTKSTPAVVEPLSKAKSKIKTTLTSKRDENAMHGYVKRFQSHWRAETECAAGYVVEDCSEYKKPKVTTTTTPSSGTTTTPTK